MKLAIRKLTKDLSLPLRGDGDLIKRIERCLAASDRDVRIFPETEAAIAMMPDAAMREAAARCFWRWFDVLRMFASGAEPPPRGTAFLVAVPFTVERLDALRGSPLETLVQPIEPAFSLDARDPNYPGHKAYVVAAPMVNVTATDMFCLNFMLANSHLDTPIDIVYHEMWAKHLATPDYSRGPYAFIFPAVMPDIPFETALKVDSFRGDNPWLQRGLDVILQHADHLNRHFPTLGLELRPVCRLSDALADATRFRLQLLMKRMISESGRFGGKFDPQDTFDPTFFEEVLREFPPSDESHEPVAVTRVVLGSCSFAELGEKGCAGRQIGQISAYGANGQMLAAISPLMLLGFPSTGMRGAWDDASHRSAMEVVELPSVAVDRVPVTPDGQSMLRDAKGEWRERELLLYGEPGQVLRHGTWERAIAASSFRHVAAQPQTTLSLLNEQRVAELVDEHYRSDVAGMLRSLGAEPGLSYRDAMRRLMEQWPEFGYLQLMSKSTIPPRGLWCLFHHRLARGAFFRVTDALVTMMSVTDIDERFPASFLHSPFPDVYLHFETPIALPDIEGMEPGRLTGIFVSEETLNDGTDSTPRARRVSFTFIIDEASGRYSLDHPGFDYYIEEREGEQDNFYTQMHESLHRGISEEVGPISKVDMQRGADAILSQVMLAAKILVYSTVRNARLVHHNEKTQLTELAKTQTGAARHKTALRAAAALDYIEVGPEEIRPPRGPGNTGRTVPIKWRRGFMANQAYGPRWSLHRPRFQPPVLVNAALLGEDEPPPLPSEYRIGPI